MSIANYADLQTSVAAWLHRSDLTTIIPDLITLAEAKLNRILRIRAMENTTTGSIAASVSLPTGFVEMISLTATGNGKTWPLQYRSPSSLSGETTGTPAYYSLVGDSIYFDPGTSGYTYSITYYKKFDALSGGVNWLITNAPDAYLYATLCEAAPYIKDDARLPVWEKNLSDSISNLMLADNGDRYGSALAVRLG